MFGGLKLPHPLIAKMISIHLHTLGYFSMQVEDVFEHTNCKFYLFTF